MGLQVWLPLNGNVYNLGYKNTTTIVEAQSGVVPSYSTQGKTGKCLNFNGGYYLRITGITLNEEASICCWAKTSTSKKMPWVLKYSSSNDFRLNLYVSTTGYYLNIGDSTNNPFRDESNNISALLDNKWHHFIVTFGSNVSKLYIDGKYAGTALVFRNPTSETNGEIRLGGGWINTHDYDWIGGICDFRVYDHCLSAEQVKKIAQGLVIHYPLNDSGRGKPNLIAKVTPGRNNAVFLNDYSLSFTSVKSDTYFSIWTSINLIDNNTYTLSAFVEGLKQGTSYNFALYSLNNTSMGVFIINKNGWNSFTFVKNYNTSNYETQTYNNIAVYRMLLDDSMRTIASGQGAFTIKAFKLEEGNVRTPFVPHVSSSQYTQFQLGDNIVQDISGFGHNATKVDIDYNYLTKVKYGKSAVFNGTTSRIYANDINLPNDEMTASIWVKWDSFSNSSYPYICSLGSGSKSSDHQMSLYSESPNRLGMAVNGSFINAAFNQLDTIYWHHIVFRYKGSFSQLWIDGVAQSGVTNANRPKKQTCLCLGARSNSTEGAGVAFANPFQGKLSDFRLYTTYLDDDAIKDLYKYNNPEAYVEEDQWEE